MEKLVTRITKDNYEFSGSNVNKAKYIFRYTYNMDVDMYFENGYLVVECRNMNEEAKIKWFELKMSDNVEKYLFGLSVE